MFTVLAIIAVIIFVIYLIGSGESDETDNQTSIESKPSSTSDLVVQKIETFNVGLNKVNQGLTNINNTLSDMVLVQKATQDYSVAIKIEKQRLEYLIGHVQLIIKSRKSTLEFRNVVEQANKKSEELKLQDPELYKECGHLLINEPVDEDLMKLAEFLRKWDFQQPIFNPIQLNQYDVKIRALVLEKVEELKLDRLDLLQMVKKELEYRNNIEVKDAVIEILQENSADYLVDDIFNSSIK